VSSTQYFTLAYLFWLIVVCAFGAVYRIAPGWLWAVLAVGTGTVVFVLKWGAL